MSLGSPRRASDRDDLGETENLPGRTAECDRLSEVLAAAFARRGRALTLRGAAGAGKTALLDECVRRGEAAGFTVVRATGVEDEVALPWATLTGLCSQHRAGIERLPGVQARAVRAALALRIADEPIDRLAVSLGVLGVFSSAAEDRPLLIVVDDLQWADADSRAALGFISRRVDHDAIAIIAASRSDPTGTFSMGEVVELAPLPDGAMRELLRRAGVTSDAARRLLTGAAAGNPLLALRLAAQLTDDERSGVAQPPPLPPVPRDIGKLYEPGLRGLSRACRDALLVFAADSSGDMAVVARALDLTGRSFEDLLAAERAGLVTDDRGTPRFVHPLARSAAYHRASAPERRAAHEVLARAEGMTSPRALIHRARAAFGPDQELADALAAQAREAKRRGAPLASAVGLEQAARSSVDPNGRGGLLVAAASAALVGGEQRWAARLLDEANAAGANSLEGRRLEVRVAIAEGRGADARRIAAEIDADHSASDPVGVAEVLVEVAPWLLVREPLDAVQLIDRITALVQAASPATVLEARILAGMGAFLAGDMASAEELMTCWPELLAAEGPVVAGPFLAGTVVLYYALSNQYTEALSVLDRLEAPMRTACSPGALLEVMAARCVVMYAADLRACVAAGREAVALGEETAQLGLVRVAEATLTIAAAGMGDRVTTEWAADRLLAQRDRMAAVVARNSLAKLELLLGRPAEALTQFKLLREVVGPVNDTNVSFEPDEAAVLVAVGRPQEAATLLEAIEGHAATSRWGVGMLARTRALLATDLAEAEEHFRAAREALTGSGVRGGLADLELGWGRRLRVAKRRAQAREHLARAVEIFAGIGADGARDVAVHELGLAGGSAVRTTSTEEILSDAELHAARLAVGGATNRDIAAQLFLSPRTVENHLGAVYRKLGVNGRAGLVARAATDAALSGRTGSVSRRG